MTDARHTTRAGAGHGWLTVLLLIFGVALLFGLAGCLDRADSGTFGGDQPVVDGGGGGGGSTATWSDIATIITDNGCHDCHNPGGPADTYCDGCHSGAYHPADIATLDYASLSGVDTTAATDTTLKRIDPGDSSNSTLYLIFSGTVSGVGMSSYMSMSSADAQTIRDWIDAGAPEN